MDSIKIGTISVKNFRNLREGSFAFSPNINCIFGKNGNGKTNLLEAIYFLSHKKSFRKKSTFKEILSLESDNSEITYSIEAIRNDDIDQYSCKFTQLSYEFYKMRTPLKTRPKIPSVFINPLDSYSFHISNTERRDWLDHHLAELSITYKKNLKSYLKLLKMRNKLLDQGCSGMLNEINAIDDIISKLIFDVTNERVVFFNSLNQVVPKIFNELFSEQLNIKLQFDSIFINKSITEIKAILREKLVIDLKNRKTSIGPHRDVFKILINDLNTENYSSLGQQKMAFLSIIFAYIELFRYKFNSYPIVLLDDVSGEVDGLRWKYLVDYLESRKFQVILTTANEHFSSLFMNNQNVKSITLENGKCV